MSAGISQWQCKTGRKKDKHGVSSPFKWAANIFVVSFLRYIILTWFFKWKGIIKHQSSARSFHLLLMTLYLTTRCLNFYPPPQGLITKPTDSAQPNYSLLVISLSHFYHLLNKAHSTCADISLFVCHFTGYDRQFLGRFLTSLAFGFPVESLLSCFLVSSRVYIRAKVAL